MNLDAAEETLAEFAVGQTVPVQLLPPGWRGTGEPVAQGGDILRIPERETVDVTPPGEVEEHGGDHVHATDGDIGRLRGFRLDPASGRVTHVLLGGGAPVGPQGGRDPVRQDRRVRPGHQAEPHQEAGAGPAGRQVAEAGRSTGGPP